MVVCEQVLEILEAADVPFIDLLRIVSDARHNRGKERYWGLFRNTTGVAEILDMWVSSENSLTGRETLREWATAYIARLVSREGDAVSQDGFLRTEKRAIDEHFALDFSLESLAGELSELCPTMMVLLSEFGTSTRQKRSNTRTGVRRHLNYGTSMLTLVARSQKNNYARHIFGLYAYASGAKRQMIELLSHLGLCSSYNTLAANLGILKRLSDACRRAARANASSRLVAFVYDNINIVFRVAEQASGNKDTMENGTCATAFELFGASEDAMQTSDLMAGIINAGPLSVSDVLFTPEESRDFKAILQHTVLNVIVTHGAGEPIARFKKDVDTFGPLLETRIPLHQTKIFPLPSMKIDESTIVGNADVTKTVLAELGQDMSADGFADVVRIIAGDQLSIARLRSLMKNRSGHDSFANSYLWAVIMPGFFHYKMATVHGIMERHYGYTTSHHNPGSLAFHNTVLDRKPITMTSLPPFRVCQDLIFVSLYARVLVCLEHVSSCESLEDYVKHVSVPEHGGTASTDSECPQTPRTQPAAPGLHQQSEQSASTPVDTVPPEPRAGTIPSLQTQGDMVYENALLFLRDALVLRALTNAIKMGVSGRIVLILKALALIYRGSGRTKYAQEVLFLIHNMTHIWPEELRKIVLNNWLVNPTGKPNAWVEVDLMQEHENFWIKTIYRAHGSNGSWEWLAMISPCIDILRRLSTQMNASLGAKLGSKHTSPSIQKDITVLMSSLHHHRVYELHPGRAIDDDKPIVPDALTYGLELLEGPLEDFNHTFTKLQARCRSTPLSTTTVVPAASSSEPQTVAVNTAPTSEGHAEGASEQLADRQSGAVIERSEDREGDGSDEDSDDDEEDDLQPQTMFSLDTPGDVALDPDRVDNFEFGL
ncbi:uncharacterized protein C8Q71DRAFT_821461 [Rhodofomes roseus]|uniref:DUF6589 domain-containing protein n=1 Tax=Rhodofomes roseus TaxID=34475 RepID=A0ABQ8KNM1_9APHY|nr:uncharacterized protein C8Q71DRAFT_821461 [Rhodofomes roseus]KAH9839465.1 hypothetical protein C8Q71DRAFT_821461 [Rhodofomes roseus]